MSAHDVSQDLVENGAAVTMLQRSASYVMNHETFIAAFASNYVEPIKWPTEVADLVSNSLPWGLVPAAVVGVTADAAEKDRATLDGLQEAGFRIDMGPGGGGLQAIHLSGRDGYYINTGTSDLIIDGTIAVKSGLEIDHFTRDGVVLSDGSVLAVDVVVLATGYGGIRESAEKLLPSAIDAVPSVYRLQDDLEMSNVWRPTPQPGLWFMTGFLASSRFYSKRLAF